MNLSNLLKNPQLIEQELRNNYDLIMRLSKKTLLKLIKNIEDPEIIYRVAIYKKIKLPPEKEQILVKFSILAFDYLIKVKKERWIELENIIATSNSQMSLDYAKTILKDRFPLAENLIIKSTHLKEYLSFLKQINKFNEFKKDYPTLFVDEQ